MSEILAQLRELTLEWEGTEAGFEPVFVAGDPALIRDLGAAALPTLISALEEEPSFVQAHVLLTYISNVEYEEFPTWNGLGVEMAADGRVRIDPAQRFELAARWKRWYESEPRPRELPPVE